MKKIFGFLLTIVFITVFTISSFAAQVLLNPKFQAFDDNGDPLSGGLVYTYIAGTTTNKATYTTSTLGVANANPVVLNSRGEADIHLNGLYKIVLKDSDTVTIWTLDNVEGQGSTIVDFTQLSEYADLATAVTAIGATKTMLYIDADDTMAANITIPATMNIIGIIGHGITTTGFTLTVNGGCQASEDMFVGTGTTAFNDSFEAGLYRVFNGDGTVTFAAGVVKAVRPEWWYAGSTDWHSAIEDAAVSIAAQGGIVQLSNYTYIVGSLTTTNWIKIPSDVTVQGVGTASEIYVADTMPNYITIFGPNGAIDAATSNVAFKNFKIDHNIANAAGTVATAGSAYHNSIYFTGTGSNFEVSGMTFDTCSGVNPIVFNASATMEDVRIINNYIKFDRQAANDHDTSTIYLHGKGFVVSGNIFEATVAEDVDTAIEVHNGPGSVTGNTIRGYLRGIFVVSEATAEAEQKNSMSVVGNSLYNVNYGIQLYADTSQILDNVVMTNNSIHLDQVTFDEITTVGVTFYYSSTDGLGDFRDIVFSNNTISFADEGAGRAGQTSPADSYGIGLNAYGDIYNIIAEGNIILNAPSNGIRVGNTTGNNTNKNVRIVGNIIENAGNNLNAVANNQRVFIFVDASAGVTMQNVIIKDNILHETNAVLRADSAIGTFDGGTITDCYIGENIISSVNGTMAVTITEEFSRMYAKTANYTLTNYDCFNNKMFSNKGDDATIVFGLPATVVGMKVGFIRLAAQLLHIDPNGTETIRGGGAGEYLILDVIGENVVLECFTTGEWEIVHENAAAITFG